MPDARSLAPFPLRSNRSGKGASEACKKKNRIWRLLKTSECGEVQTSEALGQSGQQANFAFSRREGVRPTRRINRESIFVLAPPLSRGASGNAPEFDRDSSFFKRPARRGYHGKALFHRAFTHGQGRPSVTKYKLHNLQLTSINLLLGCRVLRKCTYNNTEYFDRYSLAIKYSWAPRRRAWGSIRVVLAWQIFSERLSGDFPKRIGSAGEQSAITSANTANYWLFPTGASVHDHQ